MSGKKSLSLIMSVVLLLTVTLSSCSRGGGSGGSSNGVTGEYAANTELRLAIAYSDSETSISFDSTVGENGIILADGNCYRAGELKPVFRALSEMLNIKFTDVYMGYSPDEEINRHAADLSDVDVIRADFDSISAAGIRGDLVDLSEYLHLMPNLKSYLEANDSVRMSLLGAAERYSIYAIPSTDAVNDIDRALIMRADWVELLLNGDGEFEGDSTLIDETYYRPVMPTEGKVEVDVQVDGVIGTGVVSITKDYSQAGNIIDNMNEGQQIKPLTATLATNMLRDYIDTAYDGYYGENRADLFIGENAAYDADELVALLRCIKANSKLLCGSADIAPFFSVSGDVMTDAYALAGVLFGARGMAYEHSLYLSPNGELLDARGSERTYFALECIHRMYLEGLICESENVGLTDGFMQYTSEFEKLSTMADNGECTLILPPVARWYDGSNIVGDEDVGVFGRFYESYTQTGRYGIAISESGVGKNSDKLYAALAFIDYLFSFEGQRLVTYGPDGFSEVVENSEEEGGVCFAFTDAARLEMSLLSGMNAIDYSRRYLGGALTFIGSTDLLFEGLSERIRTGREALERGIENGIVYRPLTEMQPNMWYFSVPQYMRLTADEAELMTVVDDYIHSGKYTQTIDNRLIGIIRSGMNVESQNPYFIESNRFRFDHGGDDRLAILQKAFNRQISYYLMTRPIY